MKDRRILLTAAGLRAVGVSVVGVLLGIYLAEGGYSATTIGAVSTAGLTGAAAAALVVTGWADRWGRRRTLMGLALTGAVAGAGFLLTEEVWLLGGLAFLGMFNAMGKDRGASTVLEQATLPEAVAPERRTLAFAWYAALQDAGHSLGALLAGLPGLLAVSLGLSSLAAARWGLAIYPLLLAVGAVLYLGLSPAVEVAAEARRPSGSRLSPQGRRILWRIAALFSLDGLGGGLLVTTLLAYFFFERFEAPASTVAVLFFAARLANLGSHFAAAWLARRIGLVNTIVFTHIPSSLLLVAVAWAPNLEVAAGLFLLRAVLAEMDVPTRQSYLMAVLAPEERTVASGVTSLVRMGTWAVGPILAGFAMEHLSLVAPLLLGAAIKITYDLLLFLAFRRLRPPEELG